MDSKTALKAKKIAVMIAGKAGKILLKDLAKDKERFFKGQGDFATGTDLKIEKMAMDIIRQNFPGHSIISEEAGLTKGDSEYTWVIDPIDGTINYYHGLDPFCIGLGLMEGQEIVLNAVNSPVRGNFFLAEKGRGCLLNKKPAKAGVKEISNSIIALHISSRKEARDILLPKLEALASSGARLRILGSGLSALSLVAQGAIDAYLTLNTKAWDILPAALLVQEAGAIITDAKGGKIGLDSTSVIAANSKLHSQILEILK